MTTPPLSSSWGRFVLVASIGVEVMTGCSARNVVGEVAGKSGGIGGQTGVGGAIAPGGANGAVKSDTGGSGPGGGNDAGTGGRVLGTAGMDAAPTGGATSATGASVGGAGGNVAGGVLPLKGVSFTFVPGTASGFALADMDGDGNLDLLGLSVGTVTMMLGNGDGTFGAAVKPGPTNVTNLFAVGDLDGDGRPDLVTTIADSSAATTRETAGRVSVYTSKGGGTFSAPVEYVTDSGTHVVQIADLNGDGRMDLIVGCNQSRLDVLLNQGGGQFAQKASYICSGPAPGAPTRDIWAVQISAGDLDGDGSADLAVVFGDTGKLTFLLNQGDGTFPTSVTVPTPEFKGFLSPHTVLLADMNEDGKADFVVGGYGDNGRVFLNTGADPAAPELGRFLNGGDVLAVVDMNGDGHRDVVLPGGPVYGLFLNSGDGVSGDNASFGSYTTTAVGDLNGDGKPDLVVVGGVLLNTTP
jgi:hypothetical protein